MAHRRPVPMTAAAVAQETHEPQALAAPGVIERAFSFDLSQPLAFIALALAYVASRAPFINIGYGTDPDAWRMALSGYWLWDHHEFYPSRLPGYPVPELASAAVIKGGWLATNSLTLAVSLLGLWFFARIVVKLELPNRALLVTGFAFTPLLWINSMTTMDYMWALTFLLGCYYLLLGGHVSTAGMLLGLAAASRTTSILFFIPFAIYIVRDGRRDDLRDFAVWSIAVPMLAFVPIVWKYGPDFLSFYDAKVGYLSVLRLLAKDCLGLLGSTAVLIAAVVSLPRLTRLPGDVMRDKNVSVWIAAIGIAVLVFLRLPHESAYLIPLYPFGFFLMARYFGRYVLAGALAAILLAGFVDIGTRGEELNAQALRHARIGQGLVLSNRSTMKTQLSFSRELAKLEFPEHSVVMIGFSYPQFAVLNRDRLEIDILAKDSSSVSQLSDKGKAVDRSRNVTYVWLLDYKEFGKYISQHYPIYYTQDAGRSTNSLYHFRPGLYNKPGTTEVTMIDLGRGPSGSSGAARTDR